MTVIKDVLFLIRAYNDLDIQMSLIREFAVDPGFNVRVMAYASDGFITDLHAHEATSYLESKMGISFGSVLELPECPFLLRSAYRAQKKLCSWRMQSAVRHIGPLAFLLKAMDVGLRKVMKPALLNDQSDWLRRAAEKLEPAIIFTDEIQFQPGRAPFIDSAMPSLIEKGATAYAILTGHRVYTDINPSGSEMSSNYRPSQAKRYFVPSALNEKIYKILFPRENITVAGNLRMDREWIAFLHKNILTQKQKLPQKPVKIAMMLSKMNYGVESEELKQTIRDLGQMDHVAFAIKPHTRGMKFDFMPKSEIGHAVIADKISSAALIEWADIVLMTGSSIVFHAIILKKVAGFLKYCQKLETIFDDGACCKVFNSRDELMNYAREAAKSGINPADQDRPALRAFIESEIHGEIKSGLIAAEYKKIILTDLGLNKDTIKQHKTA